jgi:hypothetical protein
MTGTPTSPDVTGGSCPDQPARLTSAFAADVLADKDELGVNYDTVLVNPLNLMRLRADLRRTGLEQGLTTSTADDLLVQPRCLSAPRYVVASQQVGRDADREAAVHGDVARGRDVSGRGSSPASVRSCT